MKKALLFIASFFVAASLSAQISILQSEIPMIGDSSILANDTILATPISVGNSGANQVWDFSSLVQHTTDTNLILDPANTPYGADFPTANYCIQGALAGLSGFGYIDLTTSDMTLVGAASSIPGFGSFVLPFDPTQKLTDYPIDYQNNFTDVYAFSVTIDGSAFNVDSIRFKRTSDITDNIDGWGVTKTPIGSYQSLRQSRIEYAKDSIWAKVPFLGWQFFQELRDTIETYNWLAKEAGGILASVEFDSLGNLAGASYSLSPPQLPVADFTYAFGGSPNIIDFSDASENGATSWLWDFGDGNTSTQQNPTHTYAFSNGTYTVCLTVTNAFGTHTTCQTVNIVASNAAPSASNDVLSVDEGMTGTVDLLANDNEPDNQNLTATLLDMAMNGTATLDPMGVLTYVPNPCAIGTETLSYEICDDAFQPLCDTAFVVITINAVDPEADFSFAVDTSSVSFTDMTTHCPTSWTWNFGDGSPFSTDQNPMHTYTQSGTYQVCLVATNSAGNSTFCDSVTIMLSTTAIEDDVYQTQAVAYPNPATDAINLQIESLYTGELSVEIIDYTGRNIAQQQIEKRSPKAEFQFDVQNWATGVYFYFVRDAEGTYLYQNRFVVE